MGKVVMQGLHWKLCITRFSPPTLWTSLRRRALDVASVARHEDGVVVEAAGAPGTQRMGQPRRSSSAWVTLSPVSGIVKAGSWRANDLACPGTCRAHSAFSPCAFDRSHAHFAIASGAFSLPIGL